MRGSGRVAKGWMLLALGLSLAGCGDSNVFEGLSDSSGEEARLERAVQAINEEDWQQAIELLEAMDPTDPEVRKYLASAYVGYAGFDTLRLVNLAIDAQDRGQSILYDSVVGLFDGDGDGVVSSDELRAKETYLGYAVSVLAPDGVPLGDSDSEVLQTGIYAAVHAVVLVGGVLDGDDVSGDAVAGLGEAEVAARITDAAFAGIAAPLETDLGLVGGAVARVVDNALTDDFGQFLAEIGYADQDLSAQDLRGFVEGL